MFPTRTTAEPEKKKKKETSYEEHMSCFRGFSPCLNNACSLALKVVPPFPTVTGFILNH